MARSDPHWFSARWFSARSFLFAPGDRPELLRKVTHAGADAVVLDLEDAVRSENKTMARHEVGEAVAAAAGDAGPPIWVRVNALRGDAWKEDLEAVVRPGLGGVRVPKAESSEELTELHRALGEAEARAGLEAGSLAVTCTVESALGLWAAEDLARSPRVVQLAFGEADFVADIGAAPVSQATLFARSRLVVVSRVAELLPPIAPVYTHLDDDEGLERSSAEARDLGFGGRSCIHPRQLPTVHRVFTPDAAAVEQAKRVVQAAEAANGGGGLAGSEFVDAAVVRRARAVLKRAHSLEEEGT